MKRRPPGTNHWSLVFAGCRVVGLPWGAWRPWPAWRAGNGWSREATRTAYPGRSAAFYDSTSGWRKRRSGRRARAPEFPRSAARQPRVNGQIGIDPTIAPTTWRLRVTGPQGEGRARLFGLDEIKSLPRVEMTTELKCIEGWSTVVYWAGARLADFAALTGLATRSGRREDPEDLLRYAALETPDREYYVGLDMQSALHPQTLLCYEMDGQPLTPEHGAPLRLVIPVKYGIKNLKQIGTIRFTDVRPADYWAERGYDWYAGH